MSDSRNTHVLTADELARRLRLLRVVKLVAVIVGVLISPLTVVYGWGLGAMIAVVCCGAFYGAREEMLHIESRPRLFDWQSSASNVESCLAA